jgi:hypothetical protein
MEYLAYKIAVELDLEERWHIFAKRTEATEDKFKPKLRTAFSKQERSVLNNMRGKPVPDTSEAEKAINKAVSEEAEAAAESFVDDIFTIAAWQVPFENVANPFVLEAFREAGQAAFIEVGVVTAFDVTNANARKILQTRVFKFAKEVNETTQARLRTALATGFDAGEGIPELSQRVADVFDIARSSRTGAIARTEVVGASNQGTHQGFIDSKIVETEIWIDSRDARVRTSPHNHAIDGEEVKLGEKFSNGLLHPHDPNGAPGNVINCRCTTGAGKLKK